MLDGNVPHRLLVQAEGGCRMLNVEFTFQAGKQTLPTLYELAQANEELSFFLQQTGSYTVLRDVDEVYAALKGLVLELDEQIGKEQKQITAVSSLKQELLFSQLMLLIAQLFKASVESTTKSTAVQHYVKQVQSFIQQHYDREITAYQLAQHVNVHPNYLHRIFRAETGQSLVQYLNTFRLDKAKMLLRETDIGIADICELVGINSRQYFHELFKKYTDLTPVQYREQCNRQKFDGESEHSRE